jgi:hypothetical protein
MKKLRPRKNDPDKNLGLYPKFRVERLLPDARKKHKDCEYFVLDLSHDALAWEALETYEKAAGREGYHQLSEDLRVKRALHHSGLKP